MIAIAPAAESRNDEPVPSQLPIPDADRQKIDLLSQGKPEALIARFQQEIAADPEDPGACINLGTALRLAGRRPEAVAAFHQALSRKPGWDLALYSLGATLLELNDFAGAIAVGREAVALNPDSGLVHCGLGEALLKNRDLDEAKTILQRSLALDPRLHLTSQYLGSAHLFAGEIDAAVTNFRQTLCQAPFYSSGHIDLSLTLLTRGDYAEGWEEFEWRWAREGKTGTLPGFDQPVWDGSPLAGKTIVLWAEQGFGDILQFVRFAPLAQERGGEVWLVSPPKLSRLLATCRGVSRVVSGPEELGDFDFQLPLGSLPRVLGITLANLPADVPYLFPAPDRRAGDPFGPRRGDELRVGIVWGVEPGHPNWTLRSCPLPAFRALEGIPGLELYSLQFGDLAKELQQPQAPRLSDLSAVLGDFADTAALVDQLDLIITVDTAMAHLAGALGKPVWTLIPWESDWRWLRDREDSPWYPTMRLFRQGRQEPWEAVLKRVAAALRAFR